MMENDSIRDAMLERYRNKQKIVRLSLAVICLLIIDCVFDVTLVYHPCSIYISIWCVISVVLLLKVQMIGSDWWSILRPGVLVYVNPHDEKAILEWLKELNARFTVVDAGIFKFYDRRIAVMVRLMCE